jgi:MoaA/NifB/PqqE/SkfB family radical SAM enzyme
MFATMRRTYQKLRDNDAFSILAHPGVVANYLLHQGELRLRPQVMRSRPTGVEIELTNRCNLACVQCLRSRGLKAYELGEMGRETFGRVLSQFPQVINLSLNGFGEALQHPQFFELVADARRRLPWAKIGIYTNGNLIDDARAERLVGSGLTELNVSIDAARPETYRRVRRGGELAAVHAGIRRLVRFRRAAGARLPMIGTNFVLLNDNEGELVPFIEQSAELGVDFINCVTYATYDWGFDNRRSPGSYRLELAAGRQRMAELGVTSKSFATDDLSWTDQKRPFDCSFFWGSPLRITWSGDVALGCCTPFKETFSYGNVLAEPFERIWNGPAFVRNRLLARRHQPPNEICAACDRFAKTFFTPREGLPIHLGPPRGRARQGDSSDPLPRTPAGSDPRPS